MGRKGNLLQDGSKKMEQMEIRLSKEIFELLRSYGIETMSDLEAQKEIHQELTPLFLGIMRAASESLINK